MELRLHKNALREACPTRIETILTDNGTQFTDRFLRASPVTSGRGATICLR
ncbi:MAG: hypothetical protein LBO00_04910 [Zoogloeaceae bacterium]|jgi:hypothetical protein|nr:hypothetical protein [Zoogloeaceae bacterium]